MLVQLFLTLFNKFPIGQSASPGLIYTHPLLMPVRSLSSSSIAQISTDEATAGMLSSLQENLWNQNGLILLLCGVGICGLIALNQGGRVNRKNRLAT